MKAFILAAGFGTRLKPFTDHFPKPLVPVHEVPLVLYALAFLKSHGIREVVINLHHHAALLPRFLGDGRAFGMSIRYSREKIILGTGGAIKKALSLLGDDFLILNGDVLADFDLSRLMTQHRGSQNLATLALYQHPHADQYGLIHYKGKKVISILDQPTPPSGVSHAMFSGFHMVSKVRIQKRLRLLPTQTAFCVIRDVYIPELMAGQKIGAFQLKGKWAVCDRLSDVEKVEQVPLKLSYWQEAQRLSKQVKNQKMLTEILRVRKSNNS